MIRVIPWAIAAACILVEAGFATPSSAAPATPATLDDWIKQEAISASLESGPAFDAVVDKIVSALGDQVELLGFGEAMHGSEDVLQVRNRIFKRLVEAHGFRAIAIESGFPEGHRVADYVAGGPGPYTEVARGFSWGFGDLEANRELIEWMRAYNADPAHATKLNFYGFDISAIGGARIRGPDGVLHSAIDYLGTLDPQSANAHRERVDKLLSQLSGWESSDVFFNKAPAPGLAPQAAQLRVETEDLISELRTRRPDLVARTGDENYLLGLQYAVNAREMLNFHAAVARTAKEPPGGLRGVRDALQADNLGYIVHRERARGKVFAFAHNGHLMRGKSVWPCCGLKFRGSDVYEWWPAGSQLEARFGTRYAVIGTGVGSSDAENGLGPPESGTLESRLAALPGPLVFIPTHEGLGLPQAELAALRLRSGSEKNLTYTALVPQSFSDFNWILVLDSTEQTRHVAGSPAAPR